jgi:hypothetical protein
VAVALAHTHSSYQSPTLKLVLLSSYYPELRRFSANSHLSQLEYKQLGKSHLSQPCHVSRLQPDFPPIPIRRNDMKVHYFAAIATVSLLSLGSLTSCTTSQSPTNTGTEVSPAANPCASKTNPCAAKENPCASKANPCAAKENPCASKANPCAAKENPCASKANPCAAKENPCASKQ